MGRWLGVWVLLAGCSEFQLKPKPDPEVSAPTGDTAAPTTTDPTTPPLPTADTGTPPPDPTCADTPPPAISWVASPPFAAAADPRDAGGLVFFDPGADTSSWSPLVLPDRDIPIGEDRAYVGRFELTELPVDMSLNLQSDDGIVVWVNGTFVGQWGGGWQLEGCVNENAQCLVTVRVDPVEVTDLLVVGENVVAARVSNPVQNAYFEIIPECVER